MQSLLHEHCAVCTDQGNIDAVCPHLQAERFKNAAHMPSCWKAKPVPIPKRCQPLSPAQLWWKGYPSTPATTQTGAANCTHSHHGTGGYTPAWLLVAFVGSCVFMLHQQDKSMAYMEVFLTVLWKGPCPSKESRWAALCSSGDLHGKGSRHRRGELRSCSPTLGEGSDCLTFSCPKHLNGSFTTNSFTSPRWEQGTALNSCLKSNCR